MFVGERGAGGKKIRPEGGLDKFSTKGGGTFQIKRGQP